MNECVWDGSILVWMAARFAVGNSATNYMCRIPVFVYIYIYMVHAGLASGIMERCKNVFRMAFGGGWI